MAGTCHRCGTVSENLVTCDACGARVCPEHTREFGCDVCQGGTLQV